MTPGKRNLPFASMMVTFPFFGPMDPSIFAILPFSTSKSPSKTSPSLTMRAFLMRYDFNIVFGRGFFLRFREPTPNFQFHHTKDGFFDDATRHFTSPFRTVGKNHGDLLQGEPFAPSNEFHFNLEGVANEVNF